nr:integrase, catalytic region, zinc finger, CCHC-type, peptidase aspartic, catalytic [Tanacetum cinerariifolium]
QASNAAISTSVPLVVLVHVDGWVSASSCTIPTGSCTIPTGSYSFLLLDWFLLDDHNKLLIWRKGKAGKLMSRFWTFSIGRTSGPSEIIATVDGNEVVVTESLIRTHLQLNDENRLYEFTLYDVLDGIREIWQQEELVQKAQAKGVASPIEQDWLELMAKIATKFVLSKQLLGNDLNEDNMYEWLGILLIKKRRELAERSRVRPMNKTQQRDFMRDFVKNQSASVYNQGWTMKQVPAGVFATPSTAAAVLVSAAPSTATVVLVSATISTTVAVSVSAASSTAAAVSVSAAPSIPTDVSVSAAPFVHADTEVDADESRLDDPQTASEHVSTGHTVDESTPSSSCTCRKKISKKMVTLIEMVPSPLGSIHAYYDMEEHTKHFTSLRELLHMVEKNDLRKLLGAVANLYQREEPNTFALILWGDLRVLFQSLNDEDAHAFWRNQDSWRIRSWRLYPRAQVHVLETMEGRVIYMFVDVSYPLSPATLKCMLKHGLEVPKPLVGGDLTMAVKLEDLSRTDPNTLCVRKYYVSDLSSCAGSELGSELTSLAGSELGLASYKLIENYFLATYEQELCLFNFLLASYQVSSSELSPASYSNFDDSQAAGFDTRPPMLDRTDYDSWAQRIRLYCRGKENGIYILQSNYHGPFELGSTRDTLGTILEGGVLLGPERPCTYDDLNDNEKKRFDANVRATNIMLQGLPKDIYKLIKYNIEAKTQRNFARGNGVAGNGGAQIRARNVNASQGKPIKCFNCNRLGHITRTCTQPKSQQNSNYFKDKMLLMQAQENDECDAFDSNVDDEPTTQSIFIFNLSSAGPTNQQASPSNASILSKVHDLKNAIDPCDGNQDEHEIHNEVQQKNIIDSIRDHMANSNVTPCEQYLSDNNVYVVPSCASSVFNDSYVLHDNDAYIPHDPLVTELNIYKEHVAIYEQRARFELTLREQKMDEKISILIRDGNQTEENIKKELHSAQRAQPALYDGNELLKMHHVSVLVPSSKEDLELAETTRIKMNELVRVEKTSPNYFKENIMATFTPRTQLTPKQVFWSKEINAKKADDLKARTSPLLVLPLAIVYPPNTPVHLVPRTLPTTSEVNIDLYFLKFLEAEVDQNAIDLKSGEIERKNLLIVNDYLIVDWLSKDVFYTATDSMLTLSRLSDMHEALNAAQKRHHKSNRVTMPAVKSKVLAPGTYAIDIEPIPPRIRNNRKVHLDYLKHLKESVETIHEIVEEAKFGLVPSPSPAISYVPPTKKELEILFQPMFDEYFEPSSYDQQVSPAFVAHISVIPPCPSVSISVDQDALSEGHLPSSSDHPSSCIHHGVAADHSLEGTSTADSNQSTQPLEHLQKWTDSHPIDNNIRNLSCPVSTWKQLATNALWYFYNSVLSKVKPKNFKSVVTENCWFEAMQEEIYEFDRLQVWELIPPPDCAMIIALMWI